MLSTSTVRAGVWSSQIVMEMIRAFVVHDIKGKGKGKAKASSLDIAPLTVLNRGTLQPRKWQLTGNDFSTAAHAVAAQSPH